MRQGILLFAHGARDPAWATPFQALAQELRDQVGPVPVELAFLERMAPDFPTTVASLSSAGCTEILVCLLFLASGRHLAEDLPALLKGAKAAHPEVAIRVTEALGESAEIRAAVSAWILRQL
ncbi:MAG: CbiX/SirB N-terminal domain-containing protein [Betaproteobacteria bacterium]|nr:CbiX/SirB N-terminal domain-containing protein [Betaproteobacteria bacterium]